MKREVSFKFGALLLLFLGLSPSYFAQEISPIKLKDAGFTEKKFNKAEKKIFIQHFFINYQMMYGETETARGGRQAGGGYRGDASASLVLGVQGVEPDQLQKMTDSFYLKYIKQLKEAGYTIVTANELMNEEYFEGWAKLEGGTPSQAQFPGYVSTAPSGFPYLVYKVKDNGKVKTSKTIFDLAGMKLSKELDGLIVARVSITVPFAKGAESQGSRALTKSFGGVAKVVIKPELKVSPLETIQQDGDFKKPLYSGTEVTFAFKKSLKYQALYKVLPKKPIFIEGVFEEKKYKAIQSSDQDLWGTNTGALTVFSVNNEELESIQPVKCSGDAYTKGVTEAIGGFLDMALAGYLDNIK